MEPDLGVRVTVSIVSQEVVLASGGQLVGDHVFWDAYWDSPDCGLTAKDWWLRNRAGRWELKASVGYPGVLAESTLRGVLEAPNEVPDFLGLSLFQCDI